MEIVYHGSPEGGLTQIRPRVSTHGKSYVYATPDKRLAILFLQHWNDFVFNVSYGDGYVLEITERYEGALDEIYKGLSGYIYQLNAHGFTRGATGFDGEVVAELEQEVVGCQFIEDVYVELLQMGEEGALRIYRYPERPKYVPADDSDLVDRALDIARRTGDMDVVAYCIGNHPHLKHQFAACIQ